MSRLSVQGATRFYGASLLKNAQTWRGGVFSGFVGPVLYLGAIGFGLGSLVDDGGAGVGSVGGEPLSYVAFLAPGLIAATAMQTASGDAIFGTMEGMRWKRLWHTAGSTPLEPGDIALGHLLFCATHGAVAALSYAVVTVLFSILPLRDALMTVLPATLGAVAVASALMAGMVLARSEQPMNAAQRFIVIPMFLFSGVFFPISQLPDWMQPIAQSMPLWHAVQLARSWSLDAVVLDTPAPFPALPPTVVHLGVLVAVTLGGLLVSLVTFERRLRA